MLPPMIPLSAVPITSQHDPIRQRPDIPPVVPVQESSNESTIDLQQRDPEEAAFQLREEQRQVIMLRFVEELDYESVATIIGKSVPAVRVIQHRALGSLRKIMKA